MMNKLSLDELGVIHMAVSMVLMSAEADDNAPERLVELLQKAKSSLEPIIEQRFNEYTDFQSIAEHLEELEDVTEFIVKNPDSFIPDCYYS